MNQSRRIRYGVIGLGWFAQSAILPAFVNASRNSELVALFSGDEVKRAELGQRYNVSAYDYEKMEEVFARGELDAVYIVSPNSEHREHAELAARHGVHVLCEKPLAESVHACREIISACREADVKLMTAYRLHFDDAHLGLISLLQSGRIGRAKLFDSVFTQPMMEGNTRLDGDLGGSPLLDLGIYCINASRYLFRDEPIEVMAMATQPDDPRFDEVADMISVLMRFPNDRIGMFTCGFGESKVSSLRVVGTEGDVVLDGAYSHVSDMHQRISVGDTWEEETFPATDHIGPQLLYFSDCILQDADPEPNGEEGLADLRIIEAIFRSIKKGQPEKVSQFDPPARPTARQLITEPAIESPPLVHAEPPASS